MQMKRLHIPVPENLHKLASAKKAENQKFALKLRKRKPARLDEVVHSLHDKAFTEFNCLDCANCCKTISPIITQKDINRISKYLGIKAGDFVQTYLEMDEEGDFVFRNLPCPFLGKANLCAVYAERPKACREYPHTDRDRFILILDLSIKNTMVCPVVYAIFEKLQQSRVLF